jgi:hypothetical protein
MILNNSKTLITLLFLFLLEKSIFGQENNVMYHMYNVPQSHLVNPAFQPRCSFYFGIPGVSPLQLDLENSAVNFHDIVFNGVDSTITFLSPSYDKDNFVNKFSKKNLITSGLSTDIFSFGFRVNESYLTFAWTIKEAVQFTYPKDLVKFFLRGDHQGETFDWSGLGFNASSYHEFAFGISRNFSDEWTLGVNLKYLRGIANISTDNHSFKLSTTDSIYTISPDIDVNISAPMLDFQYDSIGKLKWNSIKSKKINNKADAIKYLSGERNNGFAVDLGINYNINSCLSISTSFIDMGFIRWQNEVQNLKLKGNYDFKGMYVDNLDSIKNSFEHIGDTLKNNLYSESRHSFTTVLTGKFYLGAAFNLSHSFRLGILSRTDLYENAWQEQVSFSANLKLGRFCAASASYSLINNAAQNLGVGLAIKPGPLSLYMIFDQIPLAWSRTKNFDVNYIPSRTRGFNAKIGLNFVFGERRRDKKKNDLPLIQ